MDANYIFTMPYATIQKENYLLKSKINKDPEPHEIISYMSRLQSKVTWPHQKPGNHNINEKKQSTDANAKMMQIF